MKKLILTIVLMASPMAKAMDFSINHRQGVQWVTLSGDILFGDDQKFYLFYSKISRQMPTVFSYTSAGGFIMPASLMSIMILAVTNEIQNAGFPVWGYALGECSSACIPIFMQFQNRAMNPNTVMKFHSPNDSGVPLADARARYLDLLQHHGLSLEWIKTHQDILTTAVITEASTYRPQRLLEEKTGVIRTSADLKTPEALLQKIASAHSRATPATTNSSTKKTCIVNLDGENLPGTFMFASTNTEEAKKRTIYNRAELEFLGYENISAKKYPQMDGVKFRVISNTIIPKPEWALWENESAAKPGEIVWSHKTLTKCHPSGSY